jgi:hypothetical protein
MEESQDNGKINVFSGLIEGMNPELTPGEPQRFIFEKRTYLVHI